MEHRIPLHDAYSYVKSCRSVVGEVCCVHFEMSGIICYPRHTSCHWFVEIIYLCSCIVSMLFILQCVSSYLLSIYYTQGKDCTQWRLQVPAGTMRTKHSRLQLRGECEGESLGFLWIQPNTAQSTYNTAIRWWSASIQW